MIVEYDDFDVRYKAKESDQWKTVGIDELILNYANTRWIPVTERLPEKEMLCLVSRNCTRPKLLEQVEIDFWYIPKGQSLGYWLKSSSWNVTAWMPLLEPYREADG